MRVELASSVLCLVIEYGNCNYHLSIRSYTDPTVLHRWWADPCKIPHVRREPPLRPQPPRLSMPLSLTCHDARVTSRRPTPRARPSLALARCRGLHTALSAHTCPAWSPATLAADPLALQHQEEAPRAWHVAASFCASSGE